MAFSLPPSSFGDPLKKILKDINNLSPDSPLKEVEEVSKKVDKYIKENPKLEELKVLKAELNHEIEQIETSPRGKKNKTAACLNKLISTIDEFVGNKNYLDLFKTDFEKFKTEIHKIQDKKILTQILKECAKLDFILVAKQFKNFKLGPENQDEIIEIVKECIKQCPIGSLVSLIYTLENFKIASQEKKIEIARACFELNSDVSIISFRDFGIDPENEEGIVELLKVYLKHCSEFGVRKLFTYINLSKIELKNQASLIEIAKECAKRDAQFVAECFDEFKIEATYQKEIIEIAKICAKQNGAATAKHFQNFKIDTKYQKEIIEIVKECAKKAGLETAESFQNFGIETEYQADIIEIVKKCIKNASYIITASFKKFRINNENQDAIIDIILKCAEGSPEYVAKYFKSFGIDSHNQKEIMEIAKESAKKAKSGFEENFSNFEIETKYQKEIIEIAEIRAKKEGNRLAKHFNDFNIKNSDSKVQKIIIEIAKECAKNSSSNCAQYFTNFGIDSKNQQVIIEIAKLCFQCYNSQAIRYLNSFGIDSKKVLFELAKVAAQYGGSAFGQYFENFQIGSEDQKELIELVKIYAKENGKYIAKFFKNFKIDRKNQTAIIEVAKMAAINGGEFFERNFPNFEIEPQYQKELIEIVKLCLKNSQSAIPKYFKNFNIDSENQSDIIEIIEEYANLYPDLIPEYFDNFGIKSEHQKDIIDIAQKCAKKCPEATAEHFDKFEIFPENQDEIIEIAKECVRKNGTAAATDFKNFKIDPENEEAHYEIALAYILNNNLDDPRDDLVKLGFKNIGPEKSRNLLYVYLVRNFQTAMIPNFIEDELELYKVSLSSNLARLGIRLRNFKDLLIHLVFLSGRFSFNDLIKALPEDFFDELTELLEGYQELFEKIPSFNKETLFDDFHAMRRASLAYILLKYLDGNFKSSSPETRSKQTFARGGIFSEDFVNSSIQTILSKIIKYRNANFALNLSSEIFTGLFSEASQNLAKACHKKDSLGLPSLFIARWASKSNKEEYEALLAKMSKWGTTFKDGKKGLEDVWLKTCLALNSNSEFSSTQKLSLLSKLTEGIETKNYLELIKRLNILTGISSYKDPNLLRLKEVSKIAVGKITEFLINHFNDLLLSYPLIDLSKVENLTAKYLNTLYKMRVFGAWKIYGDELMEADDEAALESFNTLILSILNSEFDKVRYEDLGEYKTSHTHMLLTKNKDVWEAWQKKDDGKIHNLKMEKGDTSEVAFHKFAKAAGDEGLLNFKSIGLSLWGFKMYLKNPKHLQSILADLDDSKAADQIQKQLIELCIEKKDQKDFISSLGNIIEQMEKELGDIKDKPFIKKLRAFIASSPETYKNQKVLVKVTDDWEDLFLSGTEVPGSCQRVDGDPKLSRGLLGYLLDGKNKMIAVKDPEDGTILTRSIFRILWNEKNNKPALFLDTIYPPSPPSQHVNLLIDYAKKEARRLKCPLYIKNQAQGFETNFDELSSLGGRAPYEYSDQSGGVCQDGIYKVEGAYKWEEFSP